MQSIWMEILHCPCLPVALNDQVFTTESENLRMPAKTIKDYIKDVFAKDLPLSIRHSSIQAVREELKVMQERTEGKQRVRVPVNFR